MHRLDERIAQYDAHIQAIAREDERARAADAPVGRGPDHRHGASLAMIGNGHEFNCGRQFAAWLGLVPGQYSSGGKTRLGRITKAGDAYLRTLLILGARAVLAAAKNKTDGVSRWALALEAAARLLEGGGGHRGEERAHGLGDAGQGRELQAAGVSEARIPLPRKTTEDRFLPPRDAPSVDEQGWTCAGCAC